MNSNKIIGRWLLVGVFMLIIQVLLGGITRLTGSGLSITEWKPIVGSIPPLNETDWNHAFELYKQKTSQYKYLNADFTLSNFKFIFFWEWLHRNWARFIGVAFIVPFIYFLYKKWITKEFIYKLLGLFVLGVFIGLLGWIMVASGLNNDNLYVNPVKLAFHFTTAIVLISATFWVALTFLIDTKNQFIDSNLYKWTIGILVLLFFQLIYGAFMAGLKAATVAPTWPSINGDYFPSTILEQNWITNPINVHFIHRTIAYVLIILIAIWYSKASKVNSSNLFNRYKILPLLFVFLQIVLGIFTVLTSTTLTRNGFGTFEYLAQLHQIVAILLVLSFVWVLFLTKKRS